MPQSESNIKMLALRVRYWAQEHRKKTFGFAFKRDLCGMCAYASTVLLHYLQISGCEYAQLAINEDHAFILANEMAIDITATQFADEQGNELKYLEMLPYEALLKKVKVPYFWRIKERADTVHQAFKLLKPFQFGGLKTGFNFPETQYWSREQDMLKTIQEAVEFCDALPFDVLELQKNLDLDQIIC